MTTGPGDRDPEPGPPVRDLALTFAGGGNRAFYQQGLLQRWGEWMLPRTAGIASCSAGAFVIVSWLAGRYRESWDFWVKRRAGVTRNVDPMNLFRGVPMAPHGVVFRETTMHVLADGGFERVKAQPFPIWILAAAFPWYLPAPLAVAVGLTGYQLVKKLFPGRIHPLLGRTLGFRPVAVDARDCATAEELTDVILASSATPPITPLGNFRGQRLLDGGLVDNVPAFVGDQVPGATRNLVFLTRKYPSDPGVVGNRLYLAPSRPVPTHRWDYTRPELVRETIELGALDADLHWPAVERFLSPHHIGS